MQSELLKRVVKFYAAMIIAAGWIAVFALLVFAQKLPFKSYTTTDGLGHNRVNRIYQDKKGFLWFATNEGLSRFDGYEFVTYGVRDGLPNLVINDIIEDREGRFWVAANDFGIALMNDKKDSAESPTESLKKFTRFWVDTKNHGSNKVDRLLIDSKDNLWCLTDDGIYRAPISDNPIFTLFQAYKSPVSSDASLALFEDQQGNIWFGIHNELFEARGDEIINHGFIDNDEKNFVINALQTKDGRILVLSRENGLFEFIKKTSEWKKLSGGTQQVNYFYSLIESADNSIWFGGAGGFLKYTSGGITEFTAAQGFQGDRTLSLFEDREGNIWSGNRGTGIVKLANLSIIGYSAAGEPSLGIKEEDGIFKIVTCNSEKKTWNCHLKISDITNRQSDESFKGILSVSKNILFAKRGNLWVLNSEMGVFPTIEDSFFYLPNGKKIDLKEFFDIPLKESDDISVYLDKENFLWIGKSNGLIERIKINEDGKRETEKFQTAYSSPVSMINDGKGNLWLFKRGALGGRLRNGKLESFDSLAQEFGKNEGFEYLKTIPSQVSTTFLDSRGWLWTGTYYEGLFVCKNPADDRPVFENYSTENGLLSDSVWAIAEDDNRRMYFGTGRGLSRLDLEKNIWNSFTTKDGLIGDRVNNLFKDSQGKIWINTVFGVTKLDPQKEAKLLEPPPVYITHLKIAGKELPISETGTIEIEPTSFNYSQNNLMVDFVGLQFKTEDSLTYRYKLEGAGDDWSSIGKNRSVTFANLESGNYRFLVQAISENGVVSTRAASFQFKILPPFYLRWWFVALGILLLSSIIYAFYRLKLQRLLEVERTRTLIATDLHDDIGSNLSKISVLSEVVRMQLDKEGKSDDRLLSSIADISRQSVGSMSDIVWAINPKRDSVLEIIRKMREYAEEIFVPKGIIVKFSEPDKSAKIKLAMDLRRDLYLIFKEAINNIAKHSNCTEVSIIFNIQHHEIILQIEDDGSGFTVTEETNGNGLINMQKRAARLKGRFHIDSAPHQGTKINIRIPQN